MPKAEVTLPASVSSVPTARHFVESILSGWGLTDLAWPATLITSELAANAALHAHGGDFTVRITADESGARIEVDDTSLRPPQQRSYSHEATTGRGLRLVSELSQEWGVTPTAAGKTVWVPLHSDRAAADEDEDDVDALLGSRGDEDDVVIALTDRRRHPDATATTGLVVAA